MNDWQGQLRTLAQQIQVKDRPAPPPRRRETVVNSPAVRWKPIDRTARLVIAPANWIHKPDAFNQRKQPEPERKEQMSNNNLAVSTMEFDEALRGPAAIPSNSGIPLGTNPQEVINIHDLAVRIIEEINRQPQRLTPLARAAIDARAVLHEGLHELGSGMEDFSARARAAIEEIRQTRFAIVGEIAHILSPLRDVRQFFIQHDHEKEVTRLREFVELCERLEGLKRRGTLDAVADTILKLADE